MPGFEGGGVFSSRQSQGRHLSRFLRFRPFLILFIGFCPLLGSAAWVDDAVRPAALTIIHTPLTQYVIGAPAEIWAVVSGEPDGLNFYFRQPGLETFQVKPMSPAEGGVFILDFDTSVLTVSSFEYYLEAWAGEEKALAPLDAPAQCHAVTGQGEAPPPIPQDIPTPQAQEAAFRLPIHLTATGMGMLSRNMKRPSAAESSASGNLQGSFDFQPARRWGLRIDATTAYTSARLPGANAVNLANLMMTFTGGSHSFKAGDLNFNESEFTVYGLGRRGFDYTFDNQKLYVRAFTASTQQMTGFAGLGFPQKQAVVYGGAAGYKVLGDALGLKAVYVGGRDDPRLGLNVGAPASATPRQGSVAALIEETHLFQQRLNLKAEYAQSRYDGDLGDEAGQASGTAYQLSGDFRLGPLAAGARYRNIGRSFNSVGLSYLANDRKGWESNMSFIKGFLSLQGLYTSEQDNIANDSSRPTTKNRMSQLNGTLNISSKFSLNGGYRRSDQASFLGGESAPLQDGQTNEASGGVSWMPSTRFSMTGMVIGSKITSRNNPGLNTEALTVNAGGSFRAGETLIISPSASWSRSDNSNLGTTGYSGNGNLSLEMWLVKQVFSVSFFGTASRTETPGAGLTRMADLTAALSFQLGSLIKFKTITLALRGNFNWQDVAGNAITDTRVYLQGDISL